MKTFLPFFVSAALLAFIAGCDSTATDNNSGGATGSTGEGSGEEVHDHTPPHGGHLIELGRNHEFHAELVDDHQAETVTIYILDNELKPLSIDSENVTLMLTVGDETKSFEIKATKEGGSSEFASGNEGMMKLIDGGEVLGKLRVTIDGQPMTGSFEHHAHDEEDHGHDHD